jgi:hypothetical protein
MAQAQSFASDPALRGDGAGPGERGLRIVRVPMARTFGFLVCRRYRSRDLRQSQGSEQAQRACSKPQPEVRARSAPNATNRRRSARRRGPCLVAGLGLRAGILASRSMFVISRDKESQRRGQASYRA